MPETMILYRNFFEWIANRHPASTSNWRKCWNYCMQILTKDEINSVLDIIHANVFTNEIQNQFSNPKARQLLGFYTNYRKDIITEGTDLFKLKQEYDKSLSIPTKRKRRSA